MSNLFTQIRLEEIANPGHVYSKPKALLRRSYFSFNEVKLTICNLRRGLDLWFHPSTTNCVGLKCISVNIRLKRVKACSTE